MNRINVNAKNLFGYIPCFIKFFPQIFRYIRLDFIFLSIFAFFLAAMSSLDAKELSNAHKLTFILAGLIGVIFFFIFCFRFSFIKLTGSFLIYKKLLIGEPVNYEEIDKIMKHKIGKIILYILCLIAFSGVALIPFLITLPLSSLGIIIPILAGVFSVALYVFLLVRYYSFSYEILIIEDIPVMKTFEKSSQVAKVNVWPFLITFIIQNFGVGVLHYIPVIGDFLSLIFGHIVVYGYIYLYLIANGQIENA